MDHRQTLLSWRNSLLCDDLCTTWSRWMGLRHHVCFQICICHLGIIFMLGWLYLNYLLHFLCLESSNGTIEDNTTGKMWVFILNLYFNNPVSLPVFTEYQGSHRKTHFTFHWLDGRNFWPWKVEMVLLWKLIILLPFMSCSTGKVFYY